jgi:hypothetical protein
MKNSQNIRNINGAFQLVPTNGAEQQTTELWSVPIGDAYEWSVQLDSNTKEKDVVFFDSNASYTINSDRVSGSITGDTEEISLTGNEDSKFTIEYMTNATADEPLIVTGSGSNVTATASGNDVQISGDAKITAKYYGEPASWAKTAVEEAFGLGLATEELLNGFQKTTTRIEFCRAAVNFLRVYGYDVDSVTPKMFSDTSDRDIGIAAALGITNGTDAEKNLFSPENPLTREQAATMLRNVMDVIGADTTPPSPVKWTDEKDISSWAQAAANVMYGAKVMNGTSATELVFSPKTPYTHEQSIITLVNLWEYINK